MLFVKGLLMSNKGVENIVYIVGMLFFFVKNLIRFLWLCFYVVYSISIRK